MKKALFGILAVALLTPGCKKEEKPSGTIYDPDCDGNIQVKGYVRDSLTLTPIPGILVGPNAVPFMIYYDTSNADGKYIQVIYWNTCAFSGYVPPSFELQVKPGQGYYFHETVDLAGSTDGSVINRDLLLVPYSQLSVHVTGTMNGQGLAIREFGAGNNPSSTIFLGWETVDTTITRDVYSNRTVPVELLVNGASHSITPYTSPYGSTATMNVSYP